VEWRLAGEKTCPSATLSTTNATWPDPGSNTGRRGGKPATNRLSYGAVLQGELSRNIEDFYYILAFHFINLNRLLDVVSKLFKILCHDAWELE
jgi:hypothetical protein